MKIETYKAKDGWRWRAVARNGNITADGAEAYANESNVKRARTSFIRSVVAMAKSGK